MNSFYLILATLQDIYLNDHRGSQRTIPKLHSERATNPWLKFP